ncbi:MAG TPA: HAD family hydrolase [Actinocrinis sp.]|nr:HAD family hydrolase [Actinocrinis sp.]
MSGPGPADEPAPATDAPTPTPAPRPARLVFCDVDETLIRTKSTLDFLDYYLTGRYGKPGARRAAAFHRDLAEHLIAGSSREQANRDYYRALAGERMADLDDWGERWFADRSAAESFYVAETRRELARHRAAGAALVLVSGSFPALLRPIAAAIGAAHLLCTTPEQRDGRLTGEVSGPPMIGPGKRAAVRGLLAAYTHIDPADCYAYGDHVSDLPLLAEVGHPVVVGGDPDLIRALPHAEVLALQWPATQAGIPSPGNDF